MESNLVLVFLCLISSLAVISIQAQNATLIDQTCKLTPDLYSLCTSTLYSDPHIRGATDARDLAVIIVFHVNEKASETRDHITGFLSDRSTDKKIKVLLKKCYDQYDTIILNWLREVREGLSYREYDPARKAMSAITTNVESCEQSFVTPVKSPISDDSKAVDELSKIALAIISYKSQHPPLIK